MGDLYIIKSPKHKVYIGQTTVDYITRFREHIYDACDPKKDHCKKLNRAIRKYGKEYFYVGLLIKCETLEELNYYEHFFIRIFESIKSGSKIKEGGRTGKQSR